ncbi:MAG: dockerin type I repeat-containing protein [Clostridia bacterium]|nr:dockerin type I repeat-containing protein [Clostridia bacterium]
MKKVISFVLATVFVLVLMPGLSSTAATVPSVYMRPIMNADKTNLTVEIYTNGLKWTAADLGIQFDPAAMTLLSVTEGSKISSARARGFDFVVGNRDLSQSNAAGYCNFVAVTGSSTCSMTSYAGPVVVYTFAVKNLGEAKTGYHLCINTLTNANGTPLVTYTSFPLASPVVHTPNAENPFKYGDVNMNGNVDSFDATLILRQVVGKSDLTEEYQKKAALVSGRSELTTFDATLILRYLVGKIESFPAEP